MRRIRSKSLIQKRRDKLTRWAIFFLVVLILILGGAIYLLQMDFWQIKQIDVTGNGIANAEEIKKEIEEKLNENVWFVIPRRNYFFLPKNEILQSLLDRPEIKDANLKIDDWFSKMQIDLTEREKFGLWCKEVVIVEEGNEDGVATDECYFLGKDGVVWGRAFESNDQFVRYYGVLNEKIIDQKYLENFTIVSEYVDFLNESQMKVEKVWALPENDVRFDLGSGFSILVNLNDGSESVKARLLLITKGEKAVIEDLSEIEYIDLRFGNKVFYKKKE